MAVLRKQVLSGVKWTSIERFYKAVAQLLQVSILTRFLDKSDFGLIGIALFVNSFCAIYADFGLASVVMHKQDLDKKTFSSFYWFNLIVGLFLSLFVMASSGLVAAYYKQPELRHVISLYSLLIFIGSIYSLQRTIQQKKMNFRFMSVVSISASTIMLVANVIFASLGFGVYSMVWASLLNGTIVALSYICLDVFKEHNICFHLKLSDIKNSFSIGVYQVGSSTLDFFSREIDAVLVSSFYSIQIFGVYTLCKQLGGRVFSVINPIVTSVLMPVFSKIQNDISYVSKIYLKTVNLLGLINFAIYSIMALASHSVLTILYGSSYASFSLVFSCFVFYYAMLSLGNPIGALMVALGRTDKGFHWTIFRVVFSIIYISIASHFSIEVLAFLIMLIPIVTSYPSWYLIHRNVTEISYGSSLSLIIKPLLICVPMFPLYYLDMWISIPLLSIVIVSLLFLAGYLILNYVFRKEELKYILSIIFKRQI